MTHEELLEDIQRGMRRVNSDVLVLAHEDRFDRPALTAALATERSTSAR
jgi:hypothetical protein